MTVSGARTVAVRLVGSMFVCAHSVDDPLDPEWDAALDSFRNVIAIADLRVLVHTDGGAPNVTQRARLMAALRGRKVPTAVMTASAVARAAGVAVSWFQPLLRVFEPSEVDAVFEHLKAEGSERAEALRVLSELRSELVVARGRRLAEP